MDDKEKIAFDQGFMAAVADIVRMHDQPTIAANVLIGSGLDEADCTHIDEFDKIELRKLNESEGLTLQGL